MSDALAPATLRALLDAAGLPGATFVAPFGHSNGRIVIDYERWIGWFADDTAEMMRRRLALSAVGVVHRHDSAARVLGAPDLATARGLAAALRRIFAAHGLAESMPLDDAVDFAASAAQCPACACERDLAAENAALRERIASMTARSDAAGNAHMTLVALLNLPMTAGWRDITAAVVAMMEVPRG